MAPSQTEIESLIIELAEKSFKTFCDDISGMFGMDMECGPQEVTPETVNGLQTRFNDLAFLLAGVVAMHPEQMILEDVESGTLEKAEKASNILKEVGTALAGSWDRVFRKGLDGHGRFVQTNTFIGNPWDKSEEKIGLKSDEELVFVSYELTIGSYPAFNCGTIFPKTIFAGTSGSRTEQPASAEEKTQEQVEQKPKGESEVKAQVETEEVAQEETVEATEAEKSAATDDQVQPAAEETVAANESFTKQEPEAVTEQKPNDVEEVTTPAEAEKRKERPISETIQKMAKSPAVLPGEHTPPKMVEKPTLSSMDPSLTVCAKDIMQKDFIWGSPDDSVQQALAKMQQHKAGYMMIGQGQVPEGIVSMSDLTGALSPYLRSIFAKWRRPMDDATLRIRVKWVMSKPACTISPETSLEATMENMCQADKKCLPVVDSQGKVQGLVTVFDIFKVLIKHSHRK
ncbi:MAG: CBS domain-containing protein [Planctomycetota bacterium]|jgi:CBS domain-containing protein